MKTINKIKNNIFNTGCIKYKDAFASKEAEYNGTYKTIKRPYIGTNNGKNTQDMNVASLFIKSPF
ncbi:MAG: hypothetical protein WC994_06075 [Brumimicrobium sp.]